MKEGMRSSLGRRPKWMTREGDDGIPRMRRKIRPPTKEELDAPDIFIGISVGLGMDSPCGCECHMESYRCLGCTEGGC